MKFKFQEPLKIFSLGIVLALRKANFVTKYWPIPINQPFAVVPAVHSVLFSFTL